MDELDGDDGVCVRFASGEEDEWLEYGSEDVRFIKPEAYVEPPTNDTPARQLDDWAPDADAGAEDADAEGGDEAADADEGDEAEDEAEDEDADEAEDEDASEDPYEWPPKGDVAECNWQVLYLDEAENAWVAGLTVSEDAATGAVRVKPVDDPDAEDLVFVSGDAKLRFMAPVD